MAAGIALIKVKIIAIKSVTGRQKYVKYVMLFVLFKTENV